MKFIDLTIPLGVATPPWPTYEPLQLKYFKRLAPNGANGQVVTHSNHLGTHLDGEIHFHTPGKDIASPDAHQRRRAPRHAPSTAVLQRVHDVAQRALVESDCANTGNRARTRAAAGADVTRSGAPRRERVAAVRA